MVLSKLEKSEFSGTIYNILLALYVYFAHAWVFEQTRQTVFYGTNSWLLGVIVLVVQIADFVFLPLKIGDIKQRLGNAQPAWKKYPFTSAVIVVGHVLTSFLMMVVMFRAFSLQTDWAVGIAGAVSTLKELILWSRVRYRAQRAAPLRAGKNLLANTSLLVYSAMAFTLAWEPLAANTSIMPYWGNWIMFSISLAIVGAITLVFLLTLRIPYLVEEWSGQVGWKTRVVFLLSFLLLWSGAVRPYFEGEVDLAAAVQNKSSVRQLYLERKALTEVPEEVWEMRALRVLDLGQNRIARIPPEIANLVKLEVFRINHNPIDSLPAEIGKLPRLRELDIRRTGILPEALGQPSDLRHVDVKR